jgi:DNA-binding response OmpR family regulator
LSPVRCAADDAGGQPDRVRARPDQRKLILIAEDDPDVARLVAFHLQHAGYRVAHAPDGLTAVNSVFEGRPDLLILDLMLPKLHGYEVCRLLRHSPLSRSLPILMLTACAGLDDKLKGFGVGTSDYMTKPFAVKELLARVGGLLARPAVEARTAPAL